MERKLLISFFVALILCYAVYAEPNKEDNSSSQITVKECVLEDDINKQDKNGKTALIRAAESGDLVKVKERVVPVGRLDMYTSGAMLLSNDGDFVNKDGEWYAPRWIQMEYILGKLYYSGPELYIYRENNKEH